eukprot:3041726-Amphidinium_carterae.1
MGGDISLSEERSPCGYYKELWRRWLAVSKDPDVPVAQWLHEGTPMGILHDIPVAGISPSAEGPSSAVLQSQ